MMRLMKRTYLIVAVLITLSFVSAALFSNLNKGNINTKPYILNQFQTVPVKKV